MVKMNRRFAMLAMVAVLSTSAAPVFANAYGASGGSIAERAMNDFQSRLGISREAAAGIVGNFAAETGNFQHYQEISPLISGSRGGAGWAQWTGPRRREFEAFAQSKGYALNSYEANLEFAIHEFTGSQSNVLRNLQGVTSAAEAAYIVRSQYERPHRSNELGPGEHPSDAHRMGYAEAYASGDFSGSPAEGAYAGGDFNYGGGFGGANGGAAPSGPAVLLMPWGQARSIGAYGVGAI